MGTPKQHELDEAFSYGRRAADNGGHLSEPPYTNKVMQKTWQAGFRTRTNERIQSNLKAVTAKRN